MLAIYIIPIIILLTWQFIFLFTYGKDIAWQKEIDNKIINLSLSINKKFKKSFFKTNSDLFYIFSINSIVASSLLLIKYMDTSQVIYYFLFITALFIWVISLSLKINIKEESIEKYIDEFLMTINVSLIFNIFDSFNWKTFILTLLVSLAIAMKYNIDKKKL